MTIRNDMTLASVPANAGVTAVLKMDRADVIGVIRNSAMKGRGGAGFPTGVKWNLAAAAQAPHKFVVCNADEGEPGTFKDRVILSEWPDLVFEGMTIAGYAIGATEGIVYLRGEYTYLRKGLEDCLARRRQANLLGERIQGKDGFSFDIHIHMGCGTYVCGEETALIESLERPSRRGPQSPAVPGEHGPQRRAHHRQQRRDLCLGGRDLRPRRRLVQDHRHGEIHRSQDAQRLRRCRDARGLRVSYGHDHPRGAESSGRGERQGGRHRRRFRSLRAGLGILSRHQL